MSEITLQHNSINAVIDTVGAWLTTLSDDKGVIVYPRTVFTTADGSSKRRGGCHACLPNFGPGGDSGLDQHGFGRTLTWYVAEQTASSVRLRLETDHDVYGAMISYLTYSLQDDGLTMELELENNGDTDLPIAPAFHPYFAYPAGTAPTLNGDELAVETLSGTGYQPAERHEIALGTRQMTIESAELNLWAIWTDNLGAYICVEPTQSGESFWRASGVEVDTLHPDDTKTYSCSISW